RPTQSGRAQRYGSHRGRCHGHHRGPRGARNSGGLMKPRRIIRHHLFWPVAALVLLLLANTAHNPSFLEVTLQNGRLYGSVVDILRNGAPTSSARSPVAGPSRAGTRSPRYSLP